MDTTTNDSNHYATAEDRAAAWRVIDCQTCQQLRMTDRKAFARHLAQEHDTTLAVIEEMR